MHSFREPATTEVKLNLTVHRADVENSIHVLCQKYAGDTEEYQMKGSQSATTRVKLRDGETLEFKTKDLMHSEMVAINWMIENGHWTLMCGTVVWNDGKKITPYQFETREPHCGFCSFFLNVLDLPLTAPTYGLFKFASRLSYILPPAIETDVNFLARVLDAGRFGGLHKVKQMLNGFVLLEPKSWVLKFENIKGMLIDDTGPALVKSEQHQITFEDFLKGKREAIYAIWKHIMEVLFKEISDLKEEEKNSKGKRRTQPYTTRRRQPRIPIRSLEKDD